LIFVWCRRRGALHGSPARAHALALPPAEAFFANWLSILLTMFVAQSLGLLIGATITNLKTAMSVTTVAMLTIMLVAGFYVQDIPVRVLLCA